MTKSRQIERLAELIRQLPRYERYLLKNGIEQTIRRFPNMTKKQVTDDFCELKAELKAAIHS